VPAPEIADSTAFAAAGDLLTSEFGAELVILNLRDGVYYGLEDVGARIWSLLREPVTLGAIRDALVAEDDVDPARCEQDLRALIRALVSKGLVRVLESR
jgi:hypothetical protein